MKYSKTTTDKAQLTFSNPFPHRTLKRSLPKIREKVIPTHIYELKRIYHGEMDQIFMMDQWAYIPIKAHKRTEERSYTEGAEGNSRKITTQTTEHFRSTSEVFLKKYLKRKQMKRRKEDNLLTNYAGPSEQKKENSSSNFLQGIIKFNHSRLEKYKTESHSMQKEKKATIQSPRTFLNDEIAQFKSQKLQLKQKLKIYDTKIKNKRFQLKIGDKRYKNILHSFQNTNKE